MCKFISREIHGSSSNPRLVSFTMESLLDLPFATLNLINGIIGNHTNSSICAPTFGAGACYELVNTK